MSEIRDVLVAVDTLIKEIDAVLKTDTAKQAPEIAKTLNVQDQLKNGVAKLEEALANFQKGIEPVRRLALIADALGAIFGMVPPFVSALGDAAMDTGGYLKTLDLRLDSAVSVAKDIDGPLKAIANKLNVADDVAETLLAFVDPARLTNILESLKTLGTDLDMLRQDPPESFSTGTSSIALNKDSARS